MSPVQFKDEFSSALIAFKSVYLGSRDLLLSEFITLANTLETIEDLLNYFDAFNSYTQKALQYYHLKPEELDSKIKDIFTEHEIFQQLAKQKQQELEIEIGEKPIYSSH